MTAYYNEIEPFAAEWLRNLIAEGLIPAGDVDTRSIVDVEPDDLVGYSQCHFFAGIGGWALAARLAGWRDDRELWTGSCPCQPFSVAGKGAGADDERHLWPHQFRLIRARRPAVWMGEQVAAAVGKDWLDGVLADLEGIGYAGRAAVVPACAVDAPHRRDRLWIVTHRAGAVDHGIGARLEGLAGHGDRSTGWAQPDRPVAATGRGNCAVADTDLALASEGREQRGREQRRAGSDSGACGGGDVAKPGCAGHDAAHRDAAEPRGDWQDDRVLVGGGGELRSGDVAHANGIGGQVDPNAGGSEAGSGAGQVVGLGSAWHGAGWVIGHDRKARRVPEPSIRLLADGLSARVGRLRAYGNAIAPPLAAEVIGAYLDCHP